MAPRGSDLVVIASASARPGSGEELERALRAVAAPTRDQAGSVAFSVYRAAHDPSTFVAFERWASREDHGRHLQSPHVATLMSAMGPILAEPPAIVEYQIVDEQIATNEDGGRPLRGRCCASRTRTGAPRAIISWRATPRGES